MRDIPGKFIGVLLAFFLCVIGPLVNTSSQQEMLTRRQVITEMDNFLDEVVDSKQYTPAMRRDLVTRINAYGVAVDFTVVKEARSVDASVTTDTTTADAATGTAVVRYIRVPMDDIGDEDVVDFKTGDRIGIECHSISLGSTQYLAHYIGGLFTPEFNYAMFKRVR